MRVVLLALKHEVFRKLSQAAMAKTEQERIHLVNIVKATFILGLDLSMCDWCKCNFKKNISYLSENTARLCCV